MENMSMADARSLMTTFQKRLSEVTTFLGVAEIVDFVVDWSATGTRNTIFECLLEELLRENFHLFFYINRALVCDRLAFPTHPA